MEITLSSKREEKTKNISNKSARKIDIKLVLILLLFIVAAFFGYSYFTQMNASEITAEEESNKIVEDVTSELGELIILPEDETPTIATIIDADKLKSQDPKFYKNAKNGDRIVFYSDKAIVFRLEEKIIVNVAQIVDQSVTDSTVEQ